MYLHGSTCYYQFSGQPKHGVLDFALISVPFSDKETSGRPRSKSDKERMAYGGDEDKTLDSEMPLERPGSPLSAMRLGDVTSISLGRD